MERDKLVAEWCRLVGKELQVAQLGPPRPQYEKRGEREAARMNMLLRQGGFGASCAKSPKWCTPVSKEDKIAQLAQFSKVGAGRGNKGASS